MNVCAIYVTYNPNMNFLKKSIMQISPQVDSVIIVDNSDYIYQESVLALSSQRVIILGQRRNCGIAKALNIGCEKAIELGAKWVITLDQDSFPPSNLIGCYKKFIFENEEKIGAVGPRFTLSEEDEVECVNTVTKVKSLITSGCFMSLEAYTQVGGFREELFIDSVDTEYSWNLRKNGFEIYQLGNVILQHHLGENAFHVKVFGKRLMTITNHNYMRCYYIARNSQQISKDYSKIFPEEARFYKNKACKKGIMVLLFEKDKFRKLRSILRGINDFRKGILGEYIEK